MTDLSREDKVKRAKQISADPEYKQSVCNEITGVSYKDIDKVLKDIINGIKPRSAQDEMYEELEELIPEKLGKKSKRPVHKTKMEYLLDQEEVNMLIRAGTEPLEEVSTTKSMNYTTYSCEEVNALIDNCYDPADFIKKYEKV